MTRKAYDVVARSYAKFLPDVSYEAPLDLAMIEHFVAQLASGGRVKSPSITSAPCSLRFGGGKPLGKPLP